MRNLRALAVLLVTTTLLLSGCASEENSDSSASSQPFNQADVKFVRAMIPHHRQAIEMAQLAEKRAADPQVEKLAEQIEAAQGPEIKTMRNWLKSWEQPTKTNQGGSGSMDHGGSGSMDHAGSGSMDHGGSVGGMAGMMAAGDMQQLRTAEGAAFDEAFLTMMIEHHKGAIDMASTEEQQGRNREAVTLAERIQQDQAAEIELMANLLGD